MARPLTKPDIKIENMFFYYRDEEIHNRRI